MNNNPMAMLINMMMSNQHPNQIVQQMLQQNPNAQILMNQLQQSGMHPRDFAFQFARQNNINMQPIMQLFNQRGIK